MPTILAYGDSITWGSSPEVGVTLPVARHPVSHRWPDVLAAQLGDGFDVINHGLRGRTTAYDEHLSDSDRNGVRLLPTVLYTHAPIDLVVIMLGSNDMKPNICGTALGAMHGMRRLMNIALNHTQGTTPPTNAKVLIVAPPPLCESDEPEFAAMFEGGIEQSKKLAALYEGVAAEKGCGFFDAGSVAKTDPRDGVHLDAENTRNIGLALAPKVRAMMIN
ncbi:MAG: SGNH/GDSL hydrolase family protein [Pseudomonadota bacterium]